MIIAHVVSCLTTGGAEKLVADMATILQKEGHKVKVISILKKRGIPYEILKGNNIEIIELNYESRFDFRIAYDIYIKTKDCDIVHTHTFYAQLYSTIFVEKRKLITTEHSTHNKRRNKKIFKLIEYFMYKKYKRIICISSATKESLNSWLKSTSGKTNIIENGIDIEKYANAKPINRKIFGLKNDKRIITCVASLTEQKNHITLIKAMKNVKEDINLLLVGDGVLKNELKQKVEELKLEKKIFFLGNQYDVPGILKISEVFILPSIWEGFGLGAVEAAASGIPVIVSNVNGLNKLFSHEEVYIVNPQDISGITNSINSIFEINKKNKRYVKQSNLEKYSIKVMTKKYMEVYLEK